MLHAQSFRRFALSTFFSFSLCCLVTHAQDARQLDAYVGQYATNDEPDLILSILHDGDHLALDTDRHPAVPLTEGPSGDFLNPDRSLRFHFVISGGKVTGFDRTEGNGQALYLRRSDIPLVHTFQPYACEERMIPMRDGIKLHAVIVRPTDRRKPLPILMERTPYGADEYNADNIYDYYPQLARSGYIFVMEDIRGRYESQGKFVMMRPIAAHHDPKSPDPAGIDESTDTWDTVDWLVKNLPANNGRVGVIGISYPGFLASEAGIDPHPAVKAISPQAPMTDVWIGDDFFHNGAFRETYGYDYVLGMEATKQATFGKLDEDAYDLFLKAGSFAQAGKKSGVDNLPTGKAFLEHPSYDVFWRARAVQDHLTKVSVPTLEVGGWWDQEDMWGTQAQYAALKPHDDKKDEVFMVLGPWKHGGWELTTRHLGAVDFGVPTGDQYREQIEAPFFAKYLKGEPGFHLEGVASFETGSNQWKYYDSWPPKAAKMRKLYLWADGSLSFDAPASDTAFRSYLSDPANPVPYRERPIEATYAPGSHWYTWLVQDQRPYADRKDVATWTTQPLTSDLTISGDVIADLVAATSGTDSDWVVKLIDVYPDDASQGNMAGYQLMIVDEIFRGRYRESYEHPQPISANQPEEYRYSLHGADHTFLKGHRIMVQVQSSWFPLYDRNPQIFVPNIMDAKKSAYQKAEQRIYDNSYIDLPVFSEK